MTSDEPQSYSVSKSVKQVIRFLPTMYAVLPFLVIDGFSLGISSSQLVRLLPASVDKDMVDKYAGIEIIILGVGSTIGGYLSGFFADKTGMKASGRIGISLWVVSIGTFILALLS